MRKQEKLSSTEMTADALHSAAIHLLRRLRLEDQSSGLSGPRLSALSVIVFGGPISVTDLAEAEQVSKPTISNLVKTLVLEGLVERRSDAGDARVVRLVATSQGRQVLLEGRRRRVQRLAHEISLLNSADRQILEDASRIIEQLCRPTSS